MAITAPIIPYFNTKNIFIEIFSITPNPVLRIGIFSFLIEFNITPVKLLRYKPGIANASKFRYGIEEEYLLPYRKFIIVPPRKVNYNYPRNRYK